MSNQVIDWDGAMEQCGDEEEFLRELLGDLRVEVGAQVVKINNAFLGQTPDKYHVIKRAAHVIKGASANLMCGHLQATSTILEHTAASGINQAPLSDELIKTHFAAMTKAFDDYNQFCESIGI